MKKVKKKNSKIQRKQAPTILPIFKDIYVYGCIVFQQKSVSAEHANGFTGTKVSAVRKRQSHFNFMFLDVNYTLQIEK